MGWNDEMMRGDGVWYHMALEYTTQLLHPILHQKPPKETETTTPKEAITCQDFKLLGAGAGKGLELSGLVEWVPAHGREVGTR